MKFIVEKSRLRGTIDVPASKSHTVRAAVFALLAEGESRILNPLESRDSAAALGACRAFGAQIEVADKEWRVRGVGKQLPVPEHVIDVLNSGTTLYILMSTAALVDGYTVITGDEQIRRRPVDKLARCLRELGAQVISTRGNELCPLVIKGPLRGGRTALEAFTSQWLTSLLINAPLARGDTEIDVLLLNEAPYVQMTLDWLDLLKIEYEHENMRRFRIPGGQSYAPFTRRVPGDFSTATFFFVAGAALDAELAIRGLDLNDSQGDKAVIDYLWSMGGQLAVGPDEIIVRRANLRGAEIDLNATPDALPAMAVAAALAEGRTSLLNVPQARVKETDRLAVMATELQKMGARIRELADGLVIEGGTLRGARLHGHNDHRVVMALTLAGLAAPGVTEIDTAEAVDVTVPDFVAIMQSLGARIRVKE